MPSLTIALAVAMQSAPAMLGDIRMHLYYESTGRLSADISPPNDFTAHNTVIGEGAAEEPANDLLVVVELRTAGQRNVATPLRIVARNANGRIIGERSFPGALTSVQGRAYLPLFLPNATCAGEIRVVATLQAQMARESMSFACGE